MKKTKGLVDPKINLLKKELKMQKEGNRLILKELEHARKVIEFVKNASAPACKGTVLNMVGEKVAKFEEAYRKKKKK